MLPLAFGGAGTVLGPFAVFWGLGALVACGVPMAAREALSKYERTKKE